MIVQRFVSLCPFVNSNEKEQLKDSKESAEIAEIARIDSPFLCFGGFACKKIVVRFSQSRKDQASQNWLESR